MVYRIFVEKVDVADGQTKKLKTDIKVALNIDLQYLRRFIRYDVEGLNSKEFNDASVSIFSEPPIDNVYYDLEMVKDKQLLVVEYLDGQYDQRADSASQCVQLLTGGIRPDIRCATVYAFENLSQIELDAIKKYLINPVDSKEGSMNLPNTLKREKVSEKLMKIEQNRFIDYNSDEIREFYNNSGFAMAIEDLVFVQDYFKGIGRNPTETELKVIDTYWSDHCRHTTFLTEIVDVQFLGNNANVQKALDLYRGIFKEMYVNRPDKYECLMDIATLAAKKLRKDGYLDNLDQSDEINACSVVVNVDNNGENEEWLIMFKNETHNHPTEIEPFGGAATCLGGAIRDPLSGRTYVYQAMRITGAADPFEKNTLKGKLPQRLLTKTALAGFSCYGNQIGLATGIVHEIYDEGFRAKRLETGYVIGGAPRENVRREKPQKGDVVLLVGGDTGRDGCGGATGSSKAHTEQSVNTCSAEVQKGNAPEERKLQRLFRNKEAAKLIIKCNDFGAGGVSVAIGELADGLDIYLDRVNKKYDGLTATELAISESQERMAVVVHKEDAEKFMAYCNKENLKVKHVADVTDTARLKMFYGKEVIVDIERKFLDTNGVKQQQAAVINENKINYFDNVEKDLEGLIKVNDIQTTIERQMFKLHSCSQKGAGETFDSTIGANTVLMPFGGIRQLTPALIMASKPPVSSGKTSTVTCSSYGIYTSLLKQSPFVGAQYSVVGAVSKLIASGVPLNTIRLTLQEFFMKLKKDPSRWGVPMSALLGAFTAQIGLKCGAIGGKDSMSGSFEHIDVPPTLIAFGMGICDEKDIIHNAFSRPGNIYFIDIPKDENNSPKFDELIDIYNKVTLEIKNKNVVHSTVVAEGGILVALMQGALGNGMSLNLSCDTNKLFKPLVGSIILVTKKPIDFGEFIGNLDVAGGVKVNGQKIDMGRVQKAFEGRLETVFPTVQDAEGTALNAAFMTSKPFKSVYNFAKPRVFIPVFPGTNCEYDTARAFERAGAKADIFVINNLTEKDIENSIQEMKKRIDDSQIIAFPGGFSGGDEPDGSGKFIATAFRNPILAESVMNLLYKRDGLALGICNGFQALIKLGLLPYGEIGYMSKNSPTLTYNNIARHVSTIVNIRIATNNSPWLSGFNVGDTYSVPVSHGEGKFVCSQDILNDLMNKGQIATQYVDLYDDATMTSPFNPNGSMNAVEGLISPDGRVLGKMGHTERCVDGLYVNVPGDYNMDIFKSGVSYYL